MSGILGMHLYRKYPHGKQFDDAIDREFGDTNNTSDPKAINES